MKKLAVILILALTITLFSPVAQATITSLACNSPDGWVFNGVDLLTLLKTTVSLDDYSVAVYGIADIDSIFHVTETITNNTGIGWDAYEVWLTGCDGEFDDTDPSHTFSSYFQTYVFGPEQNGHILANTYNSPNIVGIGETVTLDFDINICDFSFGSNFYGIGLYQRPVPIPEPTTIALLGLGGLALLRKRRT